MHYLQQFNFKADMTPQEITRRSIWHTLNYIYRDADNLQTAMENHLG